ncbi:RNA-binding protein 1-like [Babylonia areolata]|uniref:RNA-binding protein 1-like n=1 Tax=Babylonia areolata TaxID=304850 RepID=UPI003FD609FA
MSRESRSKVYVGDLGYGTTKEELEDKFARYGQLRSVWIARKPPGFAFVEYEDPRDAEDAIRALNGVRINGRRARVEMASGRRSSGGARYGGGGGGRGGGRWDPPSRGRPSYDDYRPQQRHFRESRSRSASASPPRNRNRNLTRSRSRS